MDYTKWMIGREQGKDLCNTRDEGRGGVSERVRGSDKEDKVKRAKRKRKFAGKENEHS